MHGLLKARDIIEKLRHFPWGEFNVEWAVVFGGLAERGFGRDVDILVNAKLGVEEKIELSLAIADFLDICWDCVDIVLFNEAPCPIAISAWRKGVIVYVRDKRVFREQVLARINVCEDYKLSFKKLDIIPTAIKAVKRKVGEA